MNVPTTTTTTTTDLAAVAPRRRTARRVLSSLLAALAVMVPTIGLTHTPASAAAACDTDSQDFYVTRDGTRTVRLRVTATACVSYRWDARYRTNVAYISSASSTWGAEVLNSNVQSPNWFNRTSAAVTKNNYLGMTHTIVHEFAGMYKYSRFGFGGTAYPKVTAKLDIFGFVNGGTEGLVQLSKSGSWTH